MFLKLTEKQVDEYFLATNDYIAGLTRGQVGFGHGGSYWTGVAGEAEVFAHIMENKYSGNPVFKKLFPKL